MATYGADGKNTADQLAPPSEYDPDPTELTPPPAPTDEERAAALARVKGTALPPDDKGQPEVIEVPDDKGDETVLAEIDGPGTAVALADRFDVTKAGEDWAFDMLEFKGDLLGIRLPARQALAAFSLASSKYVSLGVKNDLTGLFIARHLSPESYGRVFSRLMDPDETDYDVDTVGELFNAIVTAAVEADKAAEKAKREADGTK
jgi:hypothetical protein